VTRIRCGRTTIRPHLGCRPARSEFCFHLGRWHQIPSIRRCQASKNLAAKPSIMIQRILLLPNKILHKIAQDLFIRLFAGPSRLGKSMLQPSINLKGDRCFAHHIARSALSAEGNLDHHSPIRMPQAFIFLTLLRIPTPIPV